MERHLLWLNLSKSLSSLMPRSHTLDSLPPPLRQMLSFLKRFKEARAQSAPFRRFSLRKAKSKPSASSKPSDLSWRQSQKDGVAACETLWLVMSEDVLPLWYKWW